ncbi:MAG TPA: NADH-quinone oxidoreductase subunit NuoK, partial [Gaiellaceae bacterium]|nr:NADH-quinone oxidoreductase subunit NuoK [Gaiellaceae bacterium]
RPSRRRSWRRGARDDTREGGRARVMGPSIGWYLIVAAILFGIGALGVMLRRSPLVVLLSLEIMLNAANLTLIAFARQHGNLDGQIFALAVMAVAASEVAIGLGLIVAMARRRMALDVDHASALRG